MKTENDFIDVVMDGSSLDKKASLIPKIRAYGLEFSQQYKPLHLWLILLGKFETLGSNFRNETRFLARLLPSHAASKKSFSVFIRQH